ncbi:MAG: prephenate dehydratase [Methylococcales bacterium]|nr:prephenate dehydratase [Methylococcales bacterium]
MTDPIIPLAELRARIDVLDEQILGLINERGQCALEVARTKTAQGETGQFYRPDREAAVLRRIQELNAGPLSDTAVALLFREIMSFCLGLEQPLQVAYLGPEGTFTQQAALKHFGHAVIMQPVTAIGDIFSAVETGRADFGVAPVENSSEGMVSHTLDRFLESPLHVCGEVELRVHHNLMALTDDLSAIAQVFSHRQSLAQCRRWLDANLPGVPRQEVASNAEAARLAAQTPHSAAIAGVMAAERYGLKLIHTNIEDRADNTTRFLILGKETVAPTGHDRTSLLVSAQNKAGALYRILQPFARHGIGMMHIESRPSRQGLWEYVFFIDIQGHQQDDRVAQALTELRECTQLCQVLGSYPCSAL